MNTQTLNAIFGGLLHDLGKMVYRAGEKQDHASAGYAYLKERLKDAAWQEVLDGVRWHHLIDPDTLYPASFMRSVTVTAPDAALSDVLSTALFLLPPDEALELAGEFDGVEALLVLPDGTLKMTEGMAALLSPASP